MRTWMLTLTLVPLLVLAPACGGDEAPTPAARRR